MTTATIPVIAVQFNAANAQYDSDDSCRLSADAAVLGNSHVALTGASYYVVDTEMSTRRFSEARGVERNRVEVAALRVALTVKIMARILAYAIRHPLTEGIVDLETGEVGPRLNGQET